MNAKIARYISKWFKRKRRNLKEGQKKRLEAKIQEIEKEYEPKFKAAKDQDDYEFVRQELNYRTYPIEREIDSLDYIDILRQAQKYSVEIPKEWFLDADYPRTLTLDGERKLQKLIRQRRREEFEWWTTKVIIPIIGAITGLETISKL